MYHCVEIDVLKRLIQRDAKKEQPRDENRRKISLSEIEKLEVASNNYSILAVVFD